MWWRMSSHYNFHIQNSWLYSPPRRLLCFCSVGQGSAGRVACSTLWSMPLHLLFCFSQMETGEFSPQNFVRVSFVTVTCTPLAVNNHFAVFGRSNQKLRSRIEWAQRCRSNVCDTAVWGKLRAKNSNRARLWLAEIADRVVRVDESMIIYR